MAHTQAEGMPGQLAKGVAWIALARIVVAVIGLLSTLLLARLLSPADFGLVALATTVMTIAASLTELSLAAALVQHEAPGDNHYHTAFTLNLLRSALLGGALCLFASPIAALYGDDRLVAIMLVIGATAALGGASNPKLVALTRGLVFWQEFALATAQKLAGFIVAVGIAFALASYWALVLGSVAAQVTALVLSYMIAPYRPRFSIRHGREMFSFSLWLSLGQAVNTANWNIDKLIIGYVLGKPALGTYTVGDNLAALPTREATTPIAQTLFPAFSRMTQDPDRLRAAYGRAQATLCAVAFPVSFGFAFAADPIIRFSIGDQWQGAVRVVQVIATVVGIQALTLTLQPLAMALGETKLLFRRDALNLVIRLPVILVGLALGGFAGILYARAVAGTLATGLNMALTQRLIGIPLIRQIGRPLRYAAGSAVMIGVMAVVSAWIPPAASRLALAANTGAMAAVGALVYGAAVFGWWQLAGRPDGPERDAMRLLGKLMRRLFKHGSRRWVRLGQPA